jgi:hypothetical protein
MRVVSSITLLTLLIPIAGTAQQTSQPASANDGLTCFENLAAPDYPRAALDAHVDGSVWTWTTVSPLGSIDKVETEVVSAWSNGPGMLTPQVEKAIRAAKVKSDCAGKKVWVVFRYYLQGDAVANPKVTTRAEGPNIMWIESQPRAPAVVSSKQP